MALHGDDDKAVAYAPTREAVDNLAKLGWKAELRTYPGVGHAIPPPMRDDIFGLLRDAIEEVNQ